MKPVYVPADRQLARFAGRPDPIAAVIRRSSGGVWYDGDHPAFIGTGSSRGSRDSAGWAHRGPALWADLHRWAAANVPADAGRWLADFADRIPCGQCRRHWLAMVKQTPPPHRADALFAWTVDRHNEVNRRLRKATVTLDAAAKLWSERR